MVKICILFCIYTLLAIVSFAAPIIIEPSLAEIKVGKYLDILEDNSGQLTIDDIVSNSDSPGLKWQPSTVENPGFGFTKRVYWVRFTVRNVSQQTVKWLLLQEDPLINQIFLYAPQKHGGFKEIQAGDNFPFSKRPIAYRCVIFPLETPPLAEQTYLLRFSSNSSMNLSLTYYNHEGLEKRKNMENPILWGFAGSFFVMFIYNLAVLFYTRDTSYLYYISYIAFFGLLILTLNGLSLQYIWPESVWLNNIGPPILISLIVFSIVQFARYLLGMKSLTGFIDNTLKFYLALSLIIIVITIITVNKHSIAIILATTLTGVASISGFFFSLYHSVSKKYPIREARFFLASFAVFLIGIFLYVLRVFSLIPNTLITQYLILIGAGLQVVMLSLVLPDKLFIVKNKLNKLNLDLEKQVNERTKQLGMTQANLLQAAHNAGMADMARDTMHNIGNVINSVYTSIYDLRNIRVKDIVGRFKQANKLLGKTLMVYQPSSDEESKARMLLQYYQVLEEAIESTLEEFSTNISRISGKADEISAVIKAQNEYATTGYMKESVSIIDIMEEVLALHNQKITDHGVIVSQTFKPVPGIDSQKPKLVFIFSCILSNALDSLELSTLPERKLFIGISLVNGSVQVEITDSGIGIPNDDIKKVFRHGYSTNANKTGFSLHTCGNYVSELGGQIHCESKGPNQGATFILRFPLPDEPSSKA